MYFKKIVFENPPRYRMFHIHSKKSKLKRQYFNVSFQPRNFLANSHSEPASPTHYWYCSGLFLFSFSGSSQADILTSSLRKIHTMEDQYSQLASSVKCIHACMWSISLSLPGVHMRPSFFFFFVPKYHIPIQIPRLCFKILNLNHFIWSRVLNLSVSVGRISFCNHCNIYYSHAVSPNAPFILIKTSFKCKKSSEASWFYFNHWQVFRPLSLLISRTSLSTKFFYITDKNVCRSRQTWKFTPVSAKFGWWWYWEVPSMQIRIITFIPLLSTLLDVR